jgi:antitoxin HicB
MMNYSIIIEWSDVDQCYVVTLPEWAEQYAMPCGDGRTYDEALQSAKDALETFIDLAQKENKPLPASHVHAYVT